jgi:hypothetical protein
MASVKLRTQGGRVGWRIRFYVENRLKEVYLPGGGKRAERLAYAIAGHLECLAQALANHVSPDPAAVAWASGTTGRLRENLVAWGLADPVSPRLRTDAGRLLGPFLDAYIEGRSDVREVTRSN